MQELKETYQIIRENYLKILIISILSLFLSSPIIILVVGLQICNFKFNEKILINLLIFFLITILIKFISYEMSIDLLKIAIILIILITIFLRKFCMRKEERMDIVYIVSISIILLLSFYYPSQILIKIFKYYLILFIFFLFILIQNKKIKDLLYLKGILKMLIVGLFFYLIQYVEASIRRYNTNFSIFLLYEIYLFLEPLIYIFIFVIIKNLKKNNKKEVKNVFNII